jgi:hypothetical protein
MRYRLFRWSPLMVVALVASSIYQASAAEPFSLIDFLSGKSPAQQSSECGDCGGHHGSAEHCITRYPVEDIVIGKKKVFKSKVKYEWVSIPETRYHWKKAKITKEIPCSYCKPICVTGECLQCVGEEKWETTCDKCSERHCRHIEHRTERVPTAECQHAKGETTIKVKYHSCVKVPYIVYRQVKRPVCVKQPRYEKVEVPITRYVCKHCDGGGCADCSDK